MNYRFAKPEDQKWIDALCARENIETPKDGLCFVAEDEEGVQGFIHAVTVPMIDGFVSAVPMASAVLYEKMITALQMLGHKQAWMLPANEEIKHLASKKDWQIMRDREIIMRKDFEDVKQ